MPIRRSLLMPSPTGRLQGSPPARANRRKQRRLALAAAGVGLVLWLTFRPPFVVRPLPTPRIPGSTSQPVQTAAARFVDAIWASQVLPTVREKAQPINKILPEIRADPNAAGPKYGRREATNPYNYLVKGTGQVTEIHTGSQVGTAIVEIPTLPEKVALQIGPVIRGTALRDATGLVSFNQFTNQLDYADVSKEMNGRALKTAFPYLEVASLVGKTLTFFGAFTFDPHAKPPVLITPVAVDL
jgi:predicted lipoprotein